MPTIVREDHDDLNVTLTLNLSKEDYAPTFNEKLKEYRKNANLKGFRKGQVPVSVVRKMFGKNALVDIINDIIGKEIADYLEKADFNILGQPLPVDQKELSLSTKELEDYSFKFDLGLVPEFEVKGLDNNAFNWYDASIPDSMIEDDLKDALKRLGKQGPTEEEIQEGDVIKLSAVELSGPLPKEGGLTAEFSVSFDELTEDVVEDIFTKKTGDKLRFDITKLAKDKDKAFIEKYFLGLNEDAAEPVVYGNDFEATIVEVTRLTPATLNQEFFDGYFGPGNVTTEEEAKEKLKTNIKRYYDNQADGILFGLIVEQLKKDNQLTLPEAFLERWVEHTRELPEGKTAADAVAEMKDGLQWSIIRDKLAQKYDIKVEEVEIKQAIRGQILSYFGGQDYGGMVDNMVEKMSQDEQQVNNAYNQVLAEKLFRELKEAVTINAVPTTTDELEEIIKAEREKNEPKIEAETPLVAEEGAEVTE